MTINLSCQIAWWNVLISAQKVGITTYFPKINIFFIEFEVLYFHEKKTSSMKHDSCKMENLDIRFRVQNLATPGGCLVGLFLFMIVVVWAGWRPRENCVNLRLWGANCHPKMIKTHLFTAWGYSHLIISLPRADSGITSRTTRKSGRIMEKFCNAPKSARKHQGRWKTSAYGYVMTLVVVVTTCTGNTVTSKLPALSLNATETWELVTGPDQALFRFWEWKRSPHRSANVRTLNNSTTRRSNSQCQDKFSASHDRMHQDLRQEDQTCSSKFKVGFCQNDRNKHIKTTVCFVLNEMRVVKNFWGSLRSHKR